MTHGTDNNAARPISVDSRDVGLLASLHLQQTGSGRYRARNVPSEHRPVVFGGQLLGQMAVAATKTLDGKSVRSVQALFARAGAVEHDLSIDADVIHEGRTIGSVLVRVHQRDRVVCQGIVLLDAGDPDIIRHADSMPEVPGPEGAQPVAVEQGAEMRLVGGSAITTSDETGPPERHAWVRFPDAPADEDIHRALLAWYTDGLLIGAAMRPHPGIGEDLAHEALSTGVLTHSIVFHEQCDASEWMLITQRSTYSGSGRCYGNGAVYSPSGALLASFSQEGMIRAFPIGQQRRGASSMAM